MIQFIEKIKAVIYKRFYKNINKEKKTTKFITDDIKICLDDSDTKDSDKEGSDKENSKEENSDEEN